MPEPSQILFQAQQLPFSFPLDHEEGGDIKTTEHIALQTSKIT